jgi:hypothetical protein
VVRRAAVTAAILVLASLGGVTAVQRAQPGEVLWSVSRLVDPARAASLESRQLTDVALDQAQQAAQQGRLEDAMRQVEVAMGTVQRVRPQDGRGDLNARLTALEQRLGMTGSSTGVPSSPQPPSDTPPVSDVPSPSSVPSPPGTPSPSSPPAPSTSGPESTPPPPATSPPSSDGGTSSSGATSEPASSGVDTSALPVPTVALPGTPVAVVGVPPGPAVPSM